MRKPCPSHPATRHRFDPISTWFLAAFAIALFGVTPGCKGGGNVDVENAPYGDRTARTTVSYTVTHADQAVEDVALRYAGKKTIGGESYEGWSVPYTNATEVPSSVQAWIREPGDDRVIIAGLAKDETQTAILAEPLVVNLNAPVGQAQPIAGAAVVTTPLFPGGTEVEGSGSYTLQAKGIAVDTSAGRIYGVDHFRGTGSIDGEPVPAPLRGQTVTAEVYYHPSFGVVAASLPELGWSLGMAQSSDCGEVDAANYRLMQKTGRVDGVTSFRLSSYDCAGETFDADKNTHARMLLELRWIDETRARGTEEPGRFPACRVEFGTVTGYFPHLMVQSTKSVFHPEENNEGFTYWLAYVDQAAKNTEGDGPISYHIHIDCDEGVTPPFRASGRLYYKVLSGS